MALSPILTASPEIQLHIAAAMVGIALGPVALYMRPGMGVHRYIGYAWVTAMAVVALSSFAIHDMRLVGPFSPLHGLSALSLWSLWEGLRRVRMGQIALHRRIFRTLYWLGLVLPGLFTLLPGRLLNRALLPDLPEGGLFLLLAGLALGLVAVLRPIGIGRAARK